LNRLREKVLVASEPPAPQPVDKLPALAAMISGKKFALGRNSLDLSSIRLRFDGPTEASVVIQRLNQDLACRVGLDGVERMSKDTLIDLPFASKGHWESPERFLLVLDRVGGVDFYRFEITFQDMGNQIKVDLGERTGLVSETFRGISTP